MESKDFDPRVIDPQRGEFCNTTKSGDPIPVPPIQREPVSSRDRNPRGSRHIDKTRQDLLRADKRPRVALADKQRQWIKDHKPTRSADYIGIPR